MLRHDTVLRKCRAYCWMPAAGPLPLLAESKDYLELGLFCAEKRQEGSEGPSIFGPQAICTDVFAHHERDESLVVHGWLFPSTELCWTEES